MMKEVLKKKIFSNAFYDFFIYLRKLVENFICVFYISIFIKRIGKCKGCGKCCRHVYLRDNGKLISDFKKYFDFVYKHSKFKQFIAKGKNEDGQLFFACQHINSNNKCSIYSKRPILCRLYPDLAMLRFGAVPKIDCGFSFVNRFTGKKIV